MTGSFSLNLDRMTYWVKPKNWLNVLRQERVTYLLTQLISATRLSSENRGESSIRSPGLLLNSIRDNFRYLAETKTVAEKLVAEREKEVFGERRGHTVGIGRKLKRPSGLPSSSTTSPPVSYETMQKTIHEIIPNVNVATLRPFESTPAPPFDYNAFMGSTNEVSQQQPGDDDEEECTNEND
ncbi:hypothetical protein LXL04_004199 [Taraxacum kok-saghyz]